MADEGNGEGFLSRWSRLKRGEVLPAPPAPAAAPDPDTTPEALPGNGPGPGPGPGPVPGLGLEAEPEVDLSSLPPLEEITAGTNISGFLRKGVPAALRNAALRRAWSADPLIRDFIGPADYAWDWNVPGGAPGYAAEIASGPDVEALADRILGLVKRETDPGSAEDAPPASMAEPGPSAAAELAPDGAAELEPDAAAELSGDPAPAAAEALAEAPSIAAPPVPLPLPSPPRPRHGGAMPT